MAHSTKTQWDFGDLFTPRETREVLSVSNLTSRIKKRLEQEWGSVWIEGEITNLRVQSSGHYYFSLKDASAQIQCVCFRNDALRFRDVIQDGRQVVVQGGISLYEPRGQYQIIVRKVEPKGVGALQLAFERLKEKLRRDGFFESTRKRALPSYVERIGLVTSSTGAALQDVLKTVRRRNPSLEITLAPCRVQGASAALEIATAIETLNLYSTQSGITLDAILVARGGGSLEDLWAFNEEIVARAVFTSRIPIVSGVGHEVDITICDLVADLRAATPTAAAEILTEGVFASRAFLEEAHLRMGRLALRFIRAQSADVHKLAARLQVSHPRKRLEWRSQRLDDLLETMRDQVHSKLKDAQLQRRSLRDRLLRMKPRARFHKSKEHLTSLDQALRSAAADQRKALERRVLELQETLRMLSPQATLLRGYSITRHSRTKKVLKKASELSTGDHIETLLAEGRLQSVVIEPAPDPKAHVDVKSPGS